nr:PREDICTED: defensin-1-like [Megachile rotundata]
MNRKIMSYDRNCAHICLGVHRNVIIRKVSRRRFVYKASEQRSIISHFTDYSKVTSTVPPQVSSRTSTKMVKIYFLAALVLMALAAIMAAPVENEYEVFVPEVEERADRHRRVTCDLLSFGGVVGDSACAANCLSMGKAGGHCEGGVCLCRKTNFKDLWDKRFG